MFTLPDDFVQAMIELNGAQGQAWLDRLPAILDDCARRWSLTLGPHVPNLSYNYVAPARRADGMPVLVKACSPNGEFPEQSAALRHYDGRGAARLLECDTDQEVMLLERLEPGAMLSTVPDDEEATAIAAGVMRALWRPAPPQHPFRSVAEWGDGFARLRRRYDGGTGPLPAALVAKAERLFEELAATADAPVVLHGDLHHYNILAAGPRGWLAIDPKGVVGEPAYEVGAFLRNELPEPLRNPQAARLTSRRLDQFAAELGLDRARLRAWALAQAVLSALWSLEDHGHGWEPMIGLAELIAAMGG